MICRGRHFRPLVTGRHAHYPAPLPLLPQWCHVTTAGSALHTSLFPAQGRALARTGAGSHTHFREGRREIPACPAAGARRGRLAALSRQATRGGLRGGGGFPDSTADCVPCHRLPPSLMLARVSRDHQCQPQGRGPALAVRRSLIGGVPRLRPRRPRPRRRAKVSGNAG